MAGVISTANLPKLLWPGLYGTFGTGYDETTQEWKRLVDIHESSQQYEEIVGHTGFGPAKVKAEGTPTQFDSQVQGFTTRFVHVAYSLGYQVTFEEQEDNLYKKVGTQRSRALGFSFRQTKENVVANFYNRAFNSSYPLADGQSLCSTAHPLVGGGTFSNALATPSDLSEASLEDLVIQMMGAVDDRGLIINVMPRLLVVARQEAFNIERILKSTFQSGTANNDINAMKSLGTFPEGWAVNRYLTSPHAFFIRSNIPTEQQIILFQRNAISFSEDNEFQTKNRSYAAYERYSVGTPDPRAIWASNGP
jgi:hypothetical protein